MHNTNGHGPKRAILYARVSTDEQVRSGYSLAQRIEALRAHAAREGYEVLEEVPTPATAGRAWSGPAWTACGIWWPPATSPWCSHKTGTDSPGSQPTITCYGASSRSAGRGCAT